MLVSALPEIRRRVPEARLVVAGDPLEPIEPRAPARVVARRLRRHRVAARLRPGRRDRAAHRVAAARRPAVPRDRVVRSPRARIRPRAAGSRLRPRRRRRRSSRVRRRACRAPEDPAALADACASCWRTRSAPPRVRRRAPRPCRPHLGRGCSSTRGALRGARGQRFGHTGSRHETAPARRQVDRATACSPPLGLLLLAPVFGAIWVWVRRDAGKPVFMSQARAGKGGEPFRLLKVRSMVPNAVRVGQELGITDDPFGVVPDDPRITKSGRVLRRTGLDELPQLVNILRGEMSIVGPRPDLVEQAAHYTRVGSPPARRPARADRLVADPRPRGDRLARADRAGPLVHRPLVALARPEDRRSSPSPSSSDPSPSPSRTR